MYRNTYATAPENLVGHLIPFCLPIFSGRQGRKENNLSYNAGSPPFNTKFQTYLSLVRDNAYATHVCMQALLQGKE